jgi:ribosome biogenesis protein MAK21
LFNADTLTELFLSDLLRPDQKLREFEMCPLSLLDKYSSGNHVSRKSRLVHWYYEDQLKKLYYSFVVALNTAAQDSVERNKEKAITAMYKLLAGNPEQEAVCASALRRPISYIIIMLNIAHC